MCISSILFISILILFSEAFVFTLLPNHLRNCHLKLWLNFWVFIQLSLSENLILQLFYHCRYFPLPKFSEPQKHIVLYLSLLSCLSFSFSYILPWSIVGSSRSQTSIYALSFRNLFWVSNTNSTINTISFSLSQPSQFLNHLSNIYQEYETQSVQISFIILSQA